MTASIAVFPGPSQNPDALRLRIAGHLEALLRQATLLESRAGETLRAEAEALRRAAQDALDAVGDPGPPPGPPLSPREREVLGLVAKGLTNPEIAGVLGVAPATIRTHVEHVFRKLDVTNRVEAAAEALRRGLATG